MAALKSFVQKVLALAFILVWAVVEALGEMRARTKRDKS